jgi:signal transduction histidine kinase
MYLCERIVRVHDGTLEILSEVEIGTIVKVTLPGAMTPELRQRIRL